MTQLSENWATLWEALADAQPDHVAVVVGDRQMRWRDLDERAAKLAGALGSNGIGAPRCCSIAAIMPRCAATLPPSAALPIASAP